MLGFYDRYSDDEDDDSAADDDLCLYSREQSQSSHYYQGGEGPGLGPGSGLEGPGSGHGHYDRLRNRPALDQYSDSGYPYEEPPGPEGYGRDYFSSEDLKHDPGHPPAGGRYVVETVHWTGE